MQLNTGLTTILHHAHSPCWRDGRSAGHVRPRPNPGCFLAQLDDISPGSSSAISPPFASLDRQATALRRGSDLAAMLLGRTRAVPAPWGAPLLRRATTPWKTRAPPDGRHCTVPHVEPRSSGVCKLGNKGRVVTQQLSRAARQQLEPRPPPAIVNPPFGSAALASDTQAESID